MKFIRKEHWAGWNSDDEEEYKWATEDSDKKLKEYAKHLEKLKPKLSKRNFEFFQKGLHDAQLISFTVGDGLHLDLENNEKINVNSFDRTLVEMKLISKWFDAIYDLKYKKVSKAVFDFPSEKPLFWGIGGDIGDWGHDELTQIDEKIFRHEILFSSGTMILVEFEKFVYRKKAYKGNRY